MTKKPDEIALFPLGIVLFPDEMIPLHIFDEGGKLSPVGCAAVITDIERTYEDGRLDIHVTGTDRFHVRRITDDGSYMRCEVEWIEDVDAPFDGPEVQRLIAQHMKLLELAGRTVRPEFYQTDGLLSYRLARNAGLELAQKQTLLEADSEKDRIDQLVGHLQHFIPKVERFETVRQKVRSNGHFSDFPPEG